MDGLWEGVPASPISAASTEHPSLRPQSYSPPAELPMPPKRHLIADPNDDNKPWKRNRIDQTSSESNSVAGSGSIVFVEARSGSCTPSPGDDAAAKEERRKALLLRLQAIGRLKKDLSRQSAPALDDDVLLVEEKSRPRAGSPSGVQLVPTTAPPASLPSSSKRNNAKQRLRSTRSRERNLPSEDDVIIVDVDTSTSSPARRGRGKSTRGRKSVSTQRNRRNVVPTRASNRVRRPRLLDVGHAEANTDVRVPTPACMSKCKRFQFCKKLTTALVRDPSASCFAAPVKELWPSEAIPRYFDIITRPMDLRTVKRNLEFSTYISPDRNGALPYSFDVEKFSEDMRLIFKNALEYNKVGDILYNSARSMLADFDRKMRNELPDIPSNTTPMKATPRRRGGVRKTRKGKAVIPPISNASDNSTSDSQSVIMVAQDTATSASRARGRSKQTEKVCKNDCDSSEPVAETRRELLDRLNYLKRSRSAVLSRTPLPKGAGYLSRAALLYGVAISHSQKKKCAEVITHNKVPSGKMVALIDMVRGAVTAGDDEDDFELEFDRLDNKMWRNVEAFLEQYVPGFKTIRQSTLGREFTTVQEVDEEIDEIQRKLKKISQSTTDVSDDESPVEKPRKNTSFFSGDAVDDSSSESESESGSDSSDESDSDDE